MRGVSPEKRLHQFAVIGKSSQELLHGRSRRLRILRIETLSCRARGARVRRARTENSCRLARLILNAANPRLFSNDGAARAPIRGRPIVLLIYFRGRDYFCGRDAVSAGFDAGPAELLLLPELLVPEILLPELSAPVARRK